MASKPPRLWLARDNDTQSWNYRILAGQRRHMKLGGWRHQDFYHGWMVRRPATAVCDIDEDDFIRAYPHLVGTLEPGEIRELEPPRFKEAKR